MSHYKKVILGATVLLFSSQAFATVTWDSCNIKRIGVTGEDNKIFRVTSCDISGNNNKWLHLAKQKNAGLATLLTALSLDKKVRLGAHFNIATTSANPTGEVTTIYLDR